MGVEEEHPHLEVRVVQSQEVLPGQLLERLPAARPVAGSIGNRLHNSGSLHTQRRDLDHRSIGRIERSSRLDC